MWVTFLMTSYLPWMFSISFPQAEMQTWCWGGAPTMFMRIPTLGPGQGDQRKLSSWKPL